MSQTYAHDGSAVYDRSSPNRLPVATVYDPALARRIALALTACASLDDVTLASVAGTGLIARFCALEEQAAKVLECLDAVTTNTDDPDNGVRIARLLLELDGPFRAALERTRL